MKANYIKNYFLPLVLLLVSMVGVSQTTFTVDGLEYEVTSTNPNEVTITGGTPATTDLVIPQTVSDGTDTFTVTRVGDRAFEQAGLTSVDLPSSIRFIDTQAFQNNQLTSLTIPSSVTSILSRAFRNNQIESLVIPNSVTRLGLGTFGSNPLETITALGINPAIISTRSNDSFGSNRNTIDLTIPPGSEADYEAATWTGFRSVNGIRDFEVGNTFTENNFNYRVTSIAPNEVEITGGTAVPQELTIAGTVSSEGSDFTVTSVGNEAFLNNELTNLTLPASITEIGNAAFRENSLRSVSLPNSLTKIGNAAFLSNELTQLLLPESITDIGAGAFNNNFLETITALGITPATIITGANDTFSSNRDNIDLTIPSGTETAYEAATWTGFRSINGILNFEVGDTFTENNFNYTVISLTPNEVEITGGTDVPSNLIIQESVPNGGRDFTVTRVGNDAFRENSLTNLSLPNSLTEIGASAFRSNQITSLILPAGITTIGNAAFLSNELTQLLLPESITDIGAGAFNNNFLETITALGITPATIITGANDTFSSNRDNIDLTIPSGTETAYEAATWTGFRSINGILNFEVGDTFTENNFNYTVISLTPNEVEITGGTDVPSNLIIQESVPSGGRDFTVTSVGNEAFLNNELTNLTLPASITEIGNAAFRENSLRSVSLPNSLTKIGDDAFRLNQITNLTLLEGITTIGNAAFLNNELTNISLPASITDIGAGAFNNNFLETINTLGSTPAAITTGANDTFSANRANIDLIVPVGTIQAYIEEGWTGFKSITEADPVIRVNLKVFLQGASLNPIAGEEALMRDNLRENEQLFTISPYDQGDTIVSSTVFETTGANAIVDWVFVELRDQNDSSFVLEDKSALLQRDGDIVDTDGTSPLSFNVAPGDYFMAINHRNHLGVITAEPVTLALNATTAVDFTNPTLVQGGTTALTEVNDIFTMIGGDPSEDGQVLSTDITEVVSEIGSSGYRNADLDMNGQVLSTDVIIGNQNIGRGQQFSDPVQAP